MDNPSPPDTVPAMTTSSAPLRGLDLLLVGVVAVLGLFLVAVLVAVLVGGPRSLPGQWSVLYNAGMVLLYSAALLGAVYLIVIRRRRVGWDALGFRPISRRWLWWAAGVALLLLPAAEAVQIATRAIVGGGSSAPQIGFLAPGGFSWTGVAGMVLAVGLVGPVAEEAVFRGLLYGWLRQRRAMAPSVVVSALVFALLHGIPSLMPALFVVGVMLALVYEWSRSLWAAIIMHCTFNTVTVLIAYTALAFGVPLE